MGIFGRTNKTAAMDNKMRSLTEKASVSLEKNGLGNQKAAVYLVLDYSGSMSGFYRDGSVQHLSEQILGLSVNLDDNANVDTFLFHHGVINPFDISLNNYVGRVEQEIRKHGMGGTNYAPVMRAVVKHYQKSKVKDPALVIFQTDGAPGDPYDTENTLREISDLPMFWDFVGFGREQNSFLDGLDNLSGRVLDNASYYHTTNPKNTTDSDLYDALTSEFSGWVRQARFGGYIS